MMVTAVGTTNEQSFLCQCDTIPVHLFTNVWLFVYQQSSYICIAVIQGLTNVLQGTQICHPKTMVWGYFPGISTCNSGIAELFHNSCDDTAVIPAVL